ncbi:hypothetical protein ASPZODRAFT_140557 [Penicilliopsis zonata CBS 506.65]|uniref:5'-3' DNA helicase ZGRF1-like N-terminal domain-containing protein n=1 Tax=Penicilliopsis zonata CBS 506.65 TaxID=1073090 RepID=A0A1L9SMG4_9EURO|nr:hypothetical protein ASPZODRAFT_140557 [Penicilliopsis zonata CBS 506.65]OJJ48244.1 hypothetical protein ASPZODRAFT_140557 [Penicilliopsis zonata CBS 506.65]
MSIPTSSAVRGAPSLNVPSSQNTAPVIKFRCLYTHDVRRKAKRWHDGYLRYHTFNKRVMVYDTPGNFIGDHHWRQDEQIQDGDELELDKGVLIQVGECMERTQTDLSGLLEKKRPSQGSPVAKEPLTQVSRVSSQTPRSLNDLLGIRKTPMGRACVPKSPYEERHQQRQQQQQQQQPSSSDTSNVERASKRQKITTEKLHEKSANAPIRPQPVVDLCEESESVPQKPRLLSRPPLVSQNARAATASSVQLSKPPPSAPSGQSICPQNMTKPTTTSSIQYSKTPSNTSGQYVMPQTARSAAKPPSIAPAARVGATSQLTSVTASVQETARSAATNAQPSTKLPSITSRQPVDSPMSAQPKDNLQVGTAEKAASCHPPRSNASPDAPINALRISSQKPRRKLMYRELLPGQTTSKSTSNVPSSAEPEPEADKENPQSPEQLSSPRPIQVAQPQIPQPTPASKAPQIPQVTQVARPRTARPVQAPAQPPQKAQPIHLQPQTGPIQAQPRLPRASTKLAPSLSESAPRFHPTIKRQENLLRKSHSDPSALETGSSRHLPGRCPETLQDHCKPQGPWTAEAMDLFDFWPPGRPKTVHNQDH